MAYESFPPDRSDIEAVTEAVEALPVAGQDTPLNSRAAKAALFCFRDKNPGLYEGLRDQIDASHEELSESLGPEYRDRDGNYVLPPVALLGVIAASTVAGAANTARSIGNALREIQSLNEHADLDTPHDAPGPDQQPPDFT